MNVHIHHTKIMHDIRFESMAIYIYGNRELDMSLTFGRYWTIIMNLVFPAICNVKAPVTLYIYNSPTIEMTPFKKFLLLCLFLLYFIFIFCGCAERCSRLPWLTALFLLPCFSPHLQGKQLPTGGQHFREKFQVFSLFFLLVLYSEGLPIMISIHTLSNHRYMHLAFSLSNQYIHIFCSQAH